MYIKSGAVDLMDSNIYGNVVRGHTSSGAGISVRQWSTDIHQTTVSVTRCRVFSNIASGDGRYWSAYGGGFVVAGATLTVTHSFIYDNSVPRGWGGGAR